MALLGNLKGSAQVFQDTEFYNGVATQSLRFEDGSSHKLTRTFSSDVDNDKKMTISVWVKRGNLNTGSTQVILANYTAVRFLGELCFDNDTDGIRFDPGGDGDGSSNAYRVITSAQFRDVGSWYHIVLAYDSTQSTDTNRVKIYVNGEQQTVVADGSGQSFPPQNYAHEYSYNGANNTIGEFGASFNSGYLDGYLSEFNFIDGLTLDPTYFGETKNGVWIAKKYTGSYGTNGYRLEFKNTSVGTGSSSTIGADTSGNDNHWTSSGIAAHDCNMPDSPENNFCTLNSVGRRYGQSYTATFSEGNLKAVQGGNATHIWGTMAINQIASQGGVYFEVRLDSTDGNRSYGGLIGDNGINNKSSSSNGATYHYPIKALIDLMSSVAGHFTTATDGGSTVNLSSNTGFSNGDIAGFAILSDGKFFCHRNGTYLTNADGNTGNPSTGANPIATIDLTEGDWIPYVGYNSSYSVNFGQDSTFAGQESSGGNSDANGIGDFKYAVPTNCLALCTSNMAEPTIGPNSATQADDHFNTVLWTGTYAPISITGVGFQPDWVWIKERNSSTEHILTDSSRGAGKFLASQATTAERTSSSQITSFDSDGFSMSSGDSGTVNGNGDTYVAWNWKANGGTTSSNSDGTITSTVQASTKAGFSIVSYTGTGSGATVGHGLGAVPQMFIVKSRDSAESWVVYHAENTSAPQTDALQLNLADATVDSAGAWNDTAPTSSVFSVGSGNASNKSGDDFIAYCFAEIEGYSKFGSYNGNGNADGTFVYTGFRPSWVLIKNTARSADWRLHDIARQPTNDDGGHILLPNSSSAEVTSEYDIDFLSNGFKLKSGDVYENGDGELLIYAAFAEQPFKYANAR